jgi:glycosyltransferase involved in cell wall biosynthesis
VSSFKTIIHLEDNEEHIARCMVGPQRYAQAERGTFPGEFPNGLSHPLRARQFMAQASGFSLLIASLAEKIPATSPRVVFWPATEAAIFHLRPRNDALRAELGISSDTCVLTYHGNVHGANFREVRSLYLAVALLNRRGIPAKLVRVGSTYIDQPPKYHQWTREFCLDMGFVVDRRRLADILAMADMYVQPGASDPFNDYRFPSKVPEFFAMGKPVVLPRTNVGLVTWHLVDAYVLDEANGPGICEAVTRLWSDHALYQRLAHGAQEFSAKFSWSRSAEALAQFYQRLAAPRQQALRIAG